MTDADGRRRARLGTILRIAPVIVVLAGIVGAVAVTTRDGGGTVKAGTAHAHATGNAPTTSASDGTTSSTIGSGATRPCPATACDTQPGQPEPSTGSSTVVTAHEPSNIMFSEISDLRFGLEVGAPSVVAGETLPGALVVRNPTGHTIRLGPCTETFMVSAMQHVGGRPLLLLTEDFECLGKGIPIGPHDEVRHSLATPDNHGWIARDGPAALGNHGGTLAPGRYLPEVQIPGRTTTVLVRATAPISVTAHPCGGYSDDLVLQMTGPKVRDAEQIARWFGYHLVVASVDGVPRDLSKDLECTRLRAIVVGGQVTGFDIG